MGKSIVKAIPVFLILIVVFVSAGCTTNVKMTDFNPYEVNKKVAVIASSDDTDDLKVVVHGGPDLDQLENITVKIDGVLVKTIDNLSAGQTILIPGYEVSNYHKRVVVTGYFDDGTYQYLVDKYF